MHFAPIFWHQKSQTCVLGLKFLAPKYRQKSARKMLMKLTLGVVYTAVAIALSIQISTISVFGNFRASWLEF